MVRATAMVLVKASTATATIASVRTALISHRFIDASILPLFQVSMGLV